MHKLLELGLSVVSLLVFFDAVGAFDYQDVDLAVGRYLSWLEVPVLLARVVASIEDLDTVNLDQEHGGTKHVASLVGCELDALPLTLLTEVYQSNFVQTFINVLFAKDLLLG